MERFKLEEHTQEREAALQWKYGNNLYEIADRGMVMYIGGKKGTYKSTLSRAILASAMNPDGYMNFKYKSNGKQIVYIDTEMPVPLFRRGQEDMLKMLGGGGFPDNYRAYRLGMMPDPVDKRNEVINYIKDNKDDIDILLIDGIADLVVDEGSVPETNILLQDIVSIAEDSDSLLIFISHTNQEGTLLNHLGKKLDRKSRVGYVLHKTAGWVILRPEKDTYEPLPVSEFSVNNERLLDPGDYIPFGIFEKEKIY